MRKYYKTGGTICDAGKAWAKKTFDTYPSAYANMAASKYCKGEIKNGFVLVRTVRLKENAVLLRTKRSLIDVYLWQKLGL